MIHQEIGGFESIPSMAGCGGDQHDRFPGDHDPDPMPRQNTIEGKTFECRPRKIFHSGFRERLVMCELQGSYVVPGPYLPQKGHNTARFRIGRVKGRRRLAD